MPPDILILTALPDELQALLALREGWESRKDQAGLEYHCLAVTNTDGQLVSIAAAWCGDMGEAAAATRAASLVTELRPQALGMCGICAGKRGSTSLGDVIVADRVYSYDHGKLVARVSEASERSETFFHDIVTYNLPLAWKMAATNLGAEFEQRTDLSDARPLSIEVQRTWLLRALHSRDKAGAPEPGQLSERKIACPDWSIAIKSLERLELAVLADGGIQLTSKGLKEAQDAVVRYPDWLPVNGAFKVHCGAIATGKTVREDPELFGRLAVFERKTIGVEMEAAAIGYVGQLTGIPAIIVKAVSDHGDGDKDDSFRKFACRASAEFLLSFVLKHVDGSGEGKPQKAVNADPSVRPVIHNLPPVRRFVGRKQLFEDVGAALAHGGRATLCGLGGMGKTAAALAFAYQQLDSGAYPGGIFWVDAQHGPQEGLAAIEPLLTARAGALDFEGAGGSSVGPSLAERARVALGMSEAATLLILDNIDGEWSKFLPGGRLVHVLATARDAASSLGRPLLVEPLALEDATALAELSSEGELSEGERRARDETIQAELGGMPLAVEIAARTVAALNLSWSEYRAHLNQHCRSALESARYTGDYPRGIFAAIDLSIERCEEGSCERRLLFAVGRFAPEPIDRQWAVEVANLGVPELALRSCGSKLRDLGLVQEQVPNEVWVLHSLVHARVTELLPEDADALGRFAKVVASAADEEHPLLTLRHLEAGHVAASASGDARAEVAILLLAAHEWRRAGFYDHATVALERALEIGQTHGDVPEERIADVMNLLGLVLSEAGKVGQAQPHLEAALSLRERLLDAGDLALAVTRINLAICYSDQGRFAEALELARRALNEDMKNPARFNADRAKFLTIYGAMVLHESRHEEALPWLDLALACAEHLFGPDHPDLAGPLLSLVHCHSLADRHEDAVLAARRAVEVSVSGMGNRHPRVARSRLALGVALYSVGHNAEAEQELRAVIDLSRETDFAPALLPALGRLGIELAEAGRLEEGLPFLDEALTRLGEAEVCEEVFAEHIKRTLARALRTKSQREPVEDRVRTLERALAVEESRTVIEEEMRDLTLELIREENVWRDQAERETPSPAGADDADSREGIAHARYEFAADLLTAGLHEPSLRHALRVVVDLEELGLGESRQASVAHLSVARAYFTLESKDEVRSHLQHSARIAAACLDTTDAEYVYVCQQRAELLALVGDVEEAADILVELWDSSAQEMVAEAFLQTLTAVLVCAQREDVFPKGLRRVISLALDTWKPEEHPAAMSMLERAGLLWLRHGTPDEAVCAAQRVLADAARIGASDSVRWVAWSNNLGVAQRLAGRAKESRESFRGALVAAEPHLKGEDPILKSIKANLKLPPIPVARKKYVSRKRRKRH